MPIVDNAQLRKKGWNDREVQRVEMTVNVPRPYDVHFSKIVFWSAFIVIIIANLIVSLVMIPFFIILPAWILYSIIILLAGSIGFLYNLLIMDIGHLERRHHRLAALLIPLLTAANFVVMVLTANRFIVETQAQVTQQNPWIIAVLFAGVFIMPYLVRILFSGKK